MSIYATLRTTPSRCTKPHEMLYIARGSSATLDFDLAAHAYSFTDLDQIVFLLRQGKLLYWYKMFTYLVKTRDVVVMPGKFYFTNVELLDPESESLQCKGTFVSDPTGNPAEQGYFEAVEDNHGWRDTWYLLEPRINHHCGENYDYITLVLFPEDTKCFKPTTTHGEVEFEIVARLNTDPLTHLASEDSTIIEAQHPIAIVDTLYGEI